MSKIHIYLYFIGIIFNYYVELLLFLILIHIVRATCLDLFLRECYCKKREIEICREPDISLEATLKEREQIEDMIQSTLGDL